MNNTLITKLMNPINDSRGVTLVMVAVMITVLLAMAAAAIDIGHALVARNELQNVSDAAALAGTRALGVVYSGLTMAQQQAYVLTSGDRATIVTRVQTAAAANHAAGVTISINAGDIQIGQWDPTTRVLTPSVNLPTAVRVTSRRDGAANGPISTFLAGVVGMTSVNVSAVATAELGPVNSVPPATMNAPFGISDYYFSSGFGCGDQIQFSPSNGQPVSCAGWTTYDQTPFNNNKMVTEINQMASGNNPTPGAVGGQTSLVFGNGNLGNPAWTALLNLYNYEVQNYGHWDALVPVYGPVGTTDCTPTGWKPVIGFATVRITYVGGPGNKNNAANCTGNSAPGCIKAVVQCNVFNGNNGNGLPFGPTLATIPGLVE